MLELLETTTPRLLTCVKRYRVSDMNGPLSKISFKRKHSAAFL